MRGGVVDCTATTPFGVIAAEERDDEIGALARLYRNHPAWIEAAGYISEEGAGSDVYFSAHPNEAWHLEHRGGRGVLRPGCSRDPDFVFRFTPEAIARLERAEESIGGFAVALFEGMTASDPALRIDFRLVAGFRRLLQRGYVGLLLAGGSRVLAAAARRGLHSVSDLQKLVEGARRSQPEKWELRD